ncbi:MAG TPA: HAD family hydrolase [Gemmata sp.]
MPRVPSGVRAVVFDAVGTLIVPEPSAPAVYATTARRYGLELTPAEARARFISAYRAEEAADVARGWATCEERERDRWRTIVATTLAGVSDPESCFVYLFDHFSLPTAWRVNPDAATVLSALQARGYLLGMGSNYDARLRTVLAGLPELAPVAGRVVVSAGVKWRKPARPFFEEVTRATCCAPDEVLFVGDDLQNDYAGATAAGMHALLLDPHEKGAGVPHRIKSLSELLG